MAKATWVNVNNDWKKIKNVWQNVGGTWKQKVKPKGNISGDWKEFISYGLEFRFSTAMEGYPVTIYNNHIYFTVYIVNNRWELRKVDKNGNIVDTLNIGTSASQYWTSHATRYSQYLNILQSGRALEVNLDTFSITRERSLANIGTSGVITKNNVNDFTYFKNTGYGDGNWMSFSNLDSKYIYLYKTVLDESFGYISSGIVQPDGSPSEGYGLWAYTTSGNVVRIKDIDGSDFGSATVQKYGYPAYGITTIF